MFINILIWLLLAAITVFFFWLATRAWKSRRAFIRWPGLVLSGLLGLVFALISVIGAIGLVKAYVPTGGPVQDLTVKATPQMIARGKHLADVFCAGCHTPEGQQALIGGFDMARDIPIPLGSMVSVNLTPGGPLKNWTDGEILRILREGVDPDGRLLVIMATANVRFMSDEDLHSLIAYLRSLPAVDHPTQTPPDQLTYIGILVGGSGIAGELPKVTAPIVAPPRGVTVEYGQYIVSYQDCHSCHGADLNGGTSPVVPKGPSLRAVKGWSQDQFVQTMRTGITPAGSPLKPPMPYKAIGLMEDDELGALYKYIATLW